VKIGLLGPIKFRNIGIKKLPSLYEKLLTISRIVDDFILRMSLVTHITNETRDKNPTK
jgi:hypothetical protein